MDIMHLRYFKTVADYEHITKAAEELHIAQPAVSKIIMGLEHELGVALFDRIGKKIVLNGNGKILLAYAERILQLMDGARNEILDRENKSDQGTVVLLSRVFSKFLPELVSGFKEAYPNIKLIIMQYTGNEEWDLCIDASIKPLKNTHAQLLKKEELFLAIPKGHKFSGVKNIDLRELKDEAFISLRQGSSLYEVTKYYCNQAGFEPKIVLESDTPSTLRGIVPLGLGISFIPRIAWRGFCVDSVSLAKIKKPHCVRYINLIMREKMYQSSAVRLFGAYVMEFFQQMKTDMIYKGSGVE